MTAPTPALPWFTEGVPVTHTDLNALSTLENYLYGRLLSSFRRTRPMVRVRQSSAGAQSIAANTDTLMQWQLEDYDTAAMFAPTSGVITIPVSGLWRFGAHVQLNNVAGGGMMTIRITRNSTVVTSGVVTGGSAPGRPGTLTAAQCADLLPLTAGDTLRCFVRQTGTGAASVFTGFGGAKFFAQWVGPTP